MGWLFRHNSKEDLVAELTGSQRCADGVVCRALEYTLRGNRLWSVCVHEKNGVETGRYIRLDKLCARREGRREWAWGYQTLDECSGPNACDCPLHYLDLVPPPSDSASADWRTRVRGWHAKQALRRRFFGKVAVGQVWEIAPNGQGIGQVRIHSKLTTGGRGEGSRQGWLVESVGQGGARFRCHPRYLKRLVQPIATSAATSSAITAQPSP
jgi:hypothetical protein